MKKNVLGSIRRTTNKFGIKCKKYSPEILVVTGVVGIVTSGVMACKATLKASDILEQHNDQMATVHKAEEMYSENGKYSEADMKKDTAIVYTQTAVKLVKLYAPAVVLGTASIACIIGSHHILTKRNAALAAAYKIVDTNFKDYRGRVVERFGKELDKELRYNIKAKEVEEIVVDENGNEIVEKKTVDVASINEYSDYARFFDEGCCNWTKDPELNLYFLRCQQNHANDRLQQNGYLFLNEVYGMLGIPATKAGQCVGWIYDEKHPIGDNYVDFGIYDVTDERKRAFVNGFERSILLDFNVDGDILNYI